MLVLAIPHNQVGYFSFGAITIKCRSKRSNAEPLLAAEATARHGNPFFSSLSCYHDIHRKWEKCFIFILLSDVILI